VSVFENETAIMRSCSIVLHLYRDRGMEAPERVTLKHETDTETTNSASDIVLGQPHNKRGNTQ
jgi:hypothetical protein